MRAENQRGDTYGWRDRLRLKRKYGRVYRHGEVFETSPAPNRNASRGDSIMATKALPPPEVMRQLLRYEPDTGKLFWRPRTPDMFQDGVQSASHACGRWNSRNAGREALTAINGNGYRHGCVLGHTISAHKAAWAVYHGSWPVMEIDHKNTFRSDNTIRNLRLATRGENANNTNRRHDNSSGYKGVYASRNQIGWYAQITHHGNRVHLGTFRCRTAAALAYAKQSRLLHGEFGRIS